MNLANGNGLPGLSSVMVWLNDPENWWGPSGLLAGIREHLLYTLLIVVAATVIALPIGLVIGHTGRGTLAVVGLANALRAIPALGLLILLIVVLSPHIHSRAAVPGLLARGSLPYFVPVLIVMVLLAVPPILTSTYAGVQALDPAVRDAAEGNGMTPLQVILKVELRTAAPLIISGIRSATLQIIATLAVAAYAPLVGGLGRLIIDGEQDLTDPRYGYPAMLAAGLTVALLALAADALLGLAQRKAALPGTTPPRPIRRSRRMGASLTPGTPTTGPTAPKELLMKRVIPAALVLAASTALALTACGAPGSSSASNTAQPSAVPGHAPAALPAAPGSVVIGSADFPESEVLAYIYADAMKAHGVNAQVHPNIGERPAYMAALRDGSIGAIPEYSGAILDYLNPAQTVTSPQSVYQQLRQTAQSQGLAVADYAPAQDVDTITVTKQTAAKYHLNTIKDLANIAGQLRLGAPQPFVTVPYGIPGLKHEYGVTFGQFVPLAPTGTITQTALANGTVDAADIFSTDPSITRDGLVSLKDPQNLFAAENVVPLFKQSILTQPMVDASNAVSAKLTTAALSQLDAQVAGGTAPDAVAHQWLTANGLA